MKICHTKKRIATEWIAPGKLGLIDGLIATLRPLLPNQVLLRLQPEQ